ncbi:MAG: LacI family DNA-binding transcriptional regulator [Bacteroidota bacterium]
MIEKKMTIKDIARLADVSAGTVDRVLHNRGKVSADKKARIDQVLEEINYQPNVIAKTLKNNKMYRVAVLMPAIGQDAYWSRAIQGLDEGLREFGSFGITATVHHFAVEDPDSIYRAYEALEFDGFDCILLAPIFAHNIEKIFRDADSRGVPIIAFNTHPNKQVHSAFIGQDLVQSGRVASNLIWLSQKKKGRILLLHIDETPASAPHIADKEIGFKSYLSEHGYDPSLVTSLAMNHDDERTLVQQLDDSGAVDEELSAVYITTSWAYEVAAYIKEKCSQSIIVGYDLIEPNTHLLKEGIITFLIDQNPYQQAYLGISTFCDHLIFGKPLPQEQLLPLNVAFKENLDSVLQGRPGLS